MQTERTELSIGSIGYRTQLDKGEAFLALLLVGSSCIEPRMRLRVGLPELAGRVLRKDLPSWDQMHSWATFGNGSLLELCLEAATAAEEEKEYTGTSRFWVSELIEPNNPYVPSRTLLLNYANRLRFGGDDLWHTDFKVSHQDNLVSLTIAMQVNGHILMATQELERMEPEKSTRIKEQYHGMLEAVYDGIFAQHVRSAISSRSY